MFGWQGGPCRHWMSLIATGGRLAADRVAAGKPVRTTSPSPVSLQADGHLYKRTRDEATAALRDAERLLATATGSSTVSAAIGAPDPVEAFETADLATRRAVVNFFLTVRLHPGRRGCRTFDPATVTVEWK